MLFDSREFGFERFSEEVPARCPSRDLRAPQVSLCAWCWHRGHKGVLPWLCSVRLSWVRGRGDLRLNTCCSITKAQVGPLLCAAKKTEYEGARNAKPPMLTLFEDDVTARKALEV